MFQTIAIHMFGNSHWFCNALIFTNTKTRISFYFFFLQYYLAVYPENLEGRGEPLLSHAITPRRKPGECVPEDHAHHTQYDHSFLWTS